MKFWILWDQGFFDFCNSMSTMGYQDLLPHLKDFHPIVSKASESLRGKTSRKCANKKACSSIIDEAYKFDDGMHQKKQIIRFNLPAKIGDPVELEYGEKLYTGVVTYFYDHTKNNADQSYLIVVSHPFSLEDRHVIQIDSGWTHYTYTKSVIGTNGETLVTTTLTAKCGLELESY